MLLRQIGAGLVILVAFQIRRLYGRLRVVHPLAGSRDGDLHDHVPIGGVDLLREYRGIRPCCRGCAPRRRRGRLLARLIVRADIPKPEEDTGNNDDPPSGARVLGHFRRCGHDGNLPLRGIVLRIGRGGRRRRGRCIRDRRGLNGCNGDSAAAAVVALTSFPQLTQNFSLPANCVPHFGQNAIRSSSLNFLPEHARACWSRLGRFQLEHYQGSYAFADAVFFRAA